jgi:hypothetical protein
LYARAFATCTRAGQIARVALPTPTMLGGA